MVKIIVIWINLGNITEACYVLFVLYRQVNLLWLQTSQWRRGIFQRLNDLTTRSARKYFLILLLYTMYTMMNFTNYTHRIELLFRVLVMVVFLWCFSYIFLFKHFEILFKIYLLTSWDNCVKNNIRNAYYVNDDKVDNLEPVLSCVSVWHLKTFILISWYVINGMWSNEYRKKWLIMFSDRYIYHNGL